MCNVWLGLTRESSASAAFPQQLHFSLEDGALQHSSMTVQAESVVPPCCFQCLFLPIPES